MNHSRLPHGFLSLIAKTELVIIPGVLKVYVGLKNYCSVQRAGEIVN